MPDTAAIRIALRRWGACAATLVAAILAPRAAYAYIDPGTGSLIIQGIIGGIAAAGVAIRFYWHRVKAFLTGGAAPDPADKEADPQDGQ